MTDLEAAYDELLAATPLEESPGLVRAASGEVRMLETRQIASPGEAKGGSHERGR
jgi:hypothetical protein